MITLISFGLKFVLSLIQNLKKRNYMAQEFTDSNFETSVLKSDKLTIVDFWAEWCGPCRAIGPVIEELSKDYAGKVNIGKVNVDLNPNVSMNYGITSIPAILFIKVVKWLISKSELFPNQYSKRKYKLISNSNLFYCTRAA